MNCQDMQNRISDYLDGRLSRAERDVVKTHLKECPFCSAALAVVDPVADVLLRSEDLVVPPDLADITMAAARRRVRREQPASWSLLSWWRLAPVSLQAAAVGVLVIGLGLGFVLGKSTAISIAPEATITSQEDPLEVYQLDYLGDAPSGSLTDTYLALITTGNQGGQ